MLAVFVGRNMFSGYLQPRAESAVGKCDEAPSRGQPVRQVMGGI